MSEYRDEFKQLNFGKAWDEEDWEKFFRAQEELARRVRPGPGYARRAADPGLSFRRVMRQFGMDPDDPSAAPEDFSFPSDEEALPAPRARGQRWEDAEVHTLPIYCQARCYAMRVLLSIDRFFGRMQNRVYKSEKFRRTRDAAADLQRHAAEIPQNVAAGHRIGYGGDGVKGNIARCKRALRHVDACVGLVTKLSPGRRMSAGEQKRLFQETVRLRNDLLGWIAYLRGK